MRLLSARLARFAACVVFLTAAPVIAQEQKGAVPTISVMGTGEAELKPDFARILVAVEIQADTVAQAASSNNAASERVLERIQSLGIKREDVQTINFQVFRNPDRREACPPHARNLPQPTSFRSRRATCPGSANSRAKSSPAAT